MLQLKDVKTVNVQNIKRISTVKSDGSLLASLVTLMEAGAMLCFTKVTMKQ